MRGVVKSLHRLLQVYILVHEPDAQDGSRPRVRTRMSVSRAHAHAGLARARALIARLFFLVQVNENDVSAAARLRTLCGSPAHAVAGLGPCRCKAPFSSKIEAVALLEGFVLH